MSEPYLYPQFRGQSPPGSEHHMEAFARNSCGTTRRSGYQSSEGYAPTVHKPVKMRFHQQRHRLSPFLWRSHCSLTCAGKQRGLSDPISDNGLSFTRVSSTVRHLVTMSIVGSIADHKWLLIADSIVKSSFWASHVPQNPHWRN